MGYAAVLMITNKSDAPIVTTVGDMNCMYDDGDDGSNIQTFANLTIPAGETLPADGQYVEAKSSGSCMTEPSWFSLNFAPSLSVEFRESDDNWSVECDTQHFTAFVDNDAGSHALINVTFNG